jgi:hypothetical protein
MHGTKAIIDHLLSGLPIVKFFNIPEHQENEVAEALRDMEIHFTRCCTRLYRADLTYTERHVRFTYFDEANPQRGNNLLYQRYVYSSSGAARAGNAGGRTTNGLGIFPARSKEVDSCFFWYQTPGKSAGGFPCNYKKITICYTRRGFHCFSSPGFF